MPANRAFCKGGARESVKHAEMPVTGRPAGVAAAFSPPAADDPGRTAAPAPA
jgi:hypothetical protein